MMMMLRRIDIQKKHTWFHGHGLFRNCTLLFKKLQKNYRHPVKEELLGSSTISFNQRETVTLVYKSIFILESNTVCTVNNAICCKSLSKVIKSEDCIYWFIRYVLYDDRLSKEALPCTPQIHRGTLYRALKKTLSDCSSDRK